ncbi:MAG: TIGR02300 family protein [Holosporaceae bacterium]|nr:TIGR02300 family protein [Holosporaceae bacterium]
MNREDWGIKRSCLCCGIRFYDFYKSPIVCPECNGVFDPDYLPKKKGKSIQEKRDNVVDDIDVGVDDDDMIDETANDLNTEEDGIALDDDGKN